MHTLVKFAVVAVAGSGLLGGGAQAGPVFLMTGPTGAQGGTVSDTSGGYTITASGFNADGSTHDLFYKNEGGDENGLGLVGTSDNELSLNAGGKAAANFIQFDFGGVDKAFSGGQLTVGSLTSTEKFDLFGSNTRGQLGTEIADGVGTAYDGKLVRGPRLGAVPVRIGGRPPRRRTPLRQHPRGRGRREFRRGSPSPNPVPPP